MVRSVNGVSIRAFAGAAAFYLIVTAILTYPVAWHLSDALAGYPDGDNTQAMWSSWWFKAANARSANVAGEYPCCTTRMATSSRSSR